MARKQKPPEGAPGWITTMSDMNTLLLTFFVMLVSMMTLEKPKFSRLTAALHLAGMKFKPTEGKTAIPAVSIRPKDQKSPDAQAGATDILNIEGAEAEATKTGDGVRYSFTSAELAFEEGKWELTTKQKQFLEALSAKIHGTAGTLYVYAGCDVGAGDSVYFSGGAIIPFAAAGAEVGGACDKELLSLLRATAVQKYLSDVRRDKYIREDMIIPVGLADRMPRISNPANDEERATNRYIQIFAIDRKK